MNNIPIIPITGGSCAGKSTFMAKAVRHLTRTGFTPRVSPEAATTFMLGGMEPTSPAFQENVMRFVLTMEEAFLRDAQTLEKPVILTDRGLLDQNGPYMSHEDFIALGNKVTGQPEQEFYVRARDERYAGVICLRSAACGAEEFYNTKSNETRYETLEEAKVLDVKTMHAWVGTPHLRVIENTQGQTFDQKINRALGELSRILGVPEPLEIEKRYRLWEFTPASIPDHGVAIESVQTYLVSKPGITERVRARGQNGHYIFFHTIKEPAGEGMIERERIISKREYDALLIRRDLTCQSIYKTRYCFIHQGQYCELDVFHGALEGLVIMEVEVPSLKTLVDIPEYLGRYSDETGNQKLSNFALSKVQSFEELPQAA